MFGVNSVVDLLVAAFTLFVGLLALLMPFFVMQIRDACKRIDKKMDTIIANRG